MGLRIGSDHIDRLLGFRCNVDHTSRGHSPWLGDEHAHDHIRPYLSGEVSSKHTAID